MSRLPLPVLLVITAIFLTATANSTFFSELEAIYPWFSGNAGFLVSVALTLVAATTFALALFSLMMPVRIAIALFLLVAAVTGYFTDRFGIVFDHHMLDNVVQTDMAEASDLLSWGLLARVLLLGVVAAVVMWRFPPRRLSHGRRLLHLGATACASIAVIALCIFPFSEQYAGLIRQHKALRSYANPLMPIYSAVRLSEALASEPGNQTVEPIAADAHISAEDDDEDHELIIVVVGETARRDRFSLNGYPRTTNPELEKESRLVSFSHIASCGTSTAVSVPCMFSSEGHDHFDSDHARHQQNVLDVLHNAGVSVLWRDNNSSSKGVADRVLYEDFRSPERNPVCDVECRDVGMLSGLQAFIDRQPGDILIVLHQMGNHGPAYFKRYPAAFERFKPACHSQDFADCSDEEISNAYDNAILYTDYFLSQVIGLLKQNTPAYETAMLYISDHGESLGEHGLYLHGMPYMMAPQEQTSVPILLWLGETADIDLQQALSAKDKQSSHDAVFHSLLAAFEVETSVLDRDKTLFQVSLN